MFVNIAWVKEKNQIGGDCMSEEIVKLSKLIEALSKAQAVIQGAVKDSKNPFFHSTYADLASIWEACRKPLTDNGLAVIQITKMIEGKLYLETILSHISGESISSVYPLNPMRQEKERGWFASEDPQSLGSALTYARRYTLAAIVGVSPEDDDGEAAVGRGAEMDRSKKPESLPTEGSAKDEGKITEPQRKRFYAIWKGGKKSEAEVRAYLYSTYGVEHSADILKKDYDEICKWAESREPGENG